MPTQTYTLDVSQSILPGRPSVGIRGALLHGNDTLLNAVRRAVWTANFVPQPIEEASGGRLSLHVRKVAEGRLQKRPGPSWTEVAADDRGTVWQTPDGIARRVPIRTAPEASGGLLLWKEKTGAELLVPSEASPEMIRRVLSDGVRSALTNGLPRLGWVPLHAALLSAPSDASVTGGVLLVGPSGSGKSTLTAGLMQKGWHCVSDDQVVLSPGLASKASRSCDGGSDETVVRGWRLAPTVRLRTDVWARLGLSETALGPYGRLVQTEGPRKWSVRLSEFEKQWPSRAANVAVPTRVMEVSVCDRSRSRLRSCTARELLPAVLAQSPPTAIMPASVGVAQTRRFGALLQQADCYQLEAGQDLYTEPGRLADLLARSTAYRGETSISEPVTS